MFSEMFAALHDRGLPDPSALRQRFDFALTKKLGIIKLPPAFWMRDPKINPRADHLFWAALLLKDRQQIDMALSIIAVEQAEKSSCQQDSCREQFSRLAKQLVEDLLVQFGDKRIRQQFAQELRELVPDWLASACEKPG